MTVPPTDPVEARSGPADLVIQDGHLIIRDPDLVRRLTRLARQLQTSPEVMVTQWLNTFLRDV